MLESIAKVEQTRSQRLTETFPLLSHDESQAILHKYHPDYKNEAFRGLELGPNKGDKVPHEFADLLEAHPWVKPEDINLDQIDHEVDVLVVGGGGAGASAALMAQEDAANVLLVTKLRFGDANTMMAQGGIQAASKANDTPGIHYLDVIGGGHFTNFPDLVEALVHDAPQVIKWHEDLGVMYDKEDDGTLKTIHGGGTSRMRMHAARDYTGAEIMRTLRDEVRNRQIPVIEFSPVIELLTDEQGAATGAILLNLETDEYQVVKAKTIILATGGFGRLHVQKFPTTNHYGATADGLVLAYRAGCKLAFMDTVQYHPTGAAFPEQIVGQLVTEKVRGLGAQVTNVEGHQFCYPLEPRDIEASCIIRECTELGKGIDTPTGMTGVWLDSPMIDVIHGEGTVRKRIPAMFRQYERFDLDISKQPILVFPTLHYQNGGVIIDADCATSIPNLFIAGETAGGIHGRNRLMGNSLLGVNVFGRRAGIAAAKRAKEVEYGNLSLEHVKRYEELITEAGVDTARTAPMVVPDYRREQVKERRIEIKIR
jgi:succinate dehydrogenase / fumarate reductase flavoprotein subunit